LAPFLVNVLLGAKFVQSVLLVRWMAFLPFIVSLSNIFGIQTMLTFEMKSEFSKILIASGAINLLLLASLSLLWGAEGAAIAVTVTETVVTITMAIVLRIRGYNLFRGKRLVYES
jgi:O-antigen/teichoic acid export membrane protein